ncbi:MucB/RseB C-terminal domain-containing protein [Curvibacter sp. CHRR-16]|uniref:MucB/RseB C-terminal domain-containing protein n=1 Tax=Curvibacter sp. CHRR-16 TaxID=2835872 RepID=UPI001BDA2535|nr:MucB/RseB C-terminal domain-containing protein [Curvibacter sp. CHRR-16]MBT0571359.1 MucB/RseB C-terminal domain-containing protein [Curvibacter sp. CHRR-16]
MSIAMRSRWVLLVVLCCLSVAAWAQDAVDLQTWLKRTYDASRQNSYVGTFVVSSSGRMYSARIIHASEGDLQVERIEALSGKPRITLRRNQQVMTLFPANQIAVVESRESLKDYPLQLRPGNAQVGQWYQLKPLGEERIAGMTTEVMRIAPKDALRYGYTVWADKHTGMVLRMQTMDAEGRILEQAAFSELQMGVPFSPAALAAQMQLPEGFRLVQREVTKTNAEAQGWKQTQTVVGFQTSAAYIRPTPMAASTDSSTALQWIFSDGLATVSVFVERFDPLRHTREGGLETGGSTHIWTRRHNNWWITAVGEVPMATLRQMAQGIERLQ